MGDKGGRKDKDKSKKQKEKQRQQTLRKKVSYSCICGFGRSGAGSSHSWIKRLHCPAMAVIKRLLSMCFHICLMVLSYDQPGP